MNEEIKNQLIETFEDVNGRDNIMLPTKYKAVDKVASHGYGKTRDLSGWKFEQKHFDKYSRPPTTP